MSNTGFKDFFLDFKDLNFELSSRGGIDFKEVSKKLQESKTGQFIIDISINGYSNKPDFDFTINNEHWKDKKKLFVKGEVAQKDPTALTVKRSIRLLAQSTTEYIRSRNVKTNLSKFNKFCPVEYAHLGGHFVVDEINAPQLLALWKTFDDNRNTNISESIKRVLEIRFGKKY